MSGVEERRGFLEERVRQAEATVPAVPWSERPPFSIPLPSGKALSARERPLLMGVLNVTPDSFSDGGRFLRADQAVSHGRDLAEQGADILDVGG